MSVNSAEFIAYQTSSYVQDTKKKLFMKFTILIDFVYNIRTLTS